MSNVLRRKRSLSEREFYMNAIRIRIEVTKLMASDRIVPKSYRLMCAVPTVQTAKDLVDDIVRGDRFYPSSPHGVLWRKHYLTLALADCRRLTQDVQTLRDIGLPVNLNRLANLAEMVDREIALLTGARKSVRLVGHETASDRAARLRAELRDLEGSMEGDSCPGDEIE